MHAHSSHEHPIDDALFARPFDHSLDDAAFNNHALRTFAFQFAHNAPYSKYCARRGVTPDTIDHWTQIPAVPTAAFKEVALIAGKPEDAQAVFRTSGTTQGAERRGVHYIRDVALYHASLVPTFAACVLPDGARPMMLSLGPPAEAVPDSSLSHMIDVVMAQLGADGSASFASVQDGIDVAAVSHVLADSERDDVPVCMLGTSLAFLHLLDSMTHRFTLPAGSRLMDTGGYKGRTREVGVAEMHARYLEAFAIPATHCINEYGMTEMCSQFYDSSLRDIATGRVRERCKISPPWVRTRVVDPETLEPLPDGTVGILQHFDLANAYSVMAIQTEDLGVIPDGGGLQLLGRVSGAAPRGCSIAMDILLEAVARRGA